ncbi:MAG: tetratricopeptide repeat protein, partial [Halanaerobium sp.]
LFNLGMDYFSRGDYQDAADIFNSIYNLTETDYLKRESLFLLARSHEKLENYQSGEHFYRIYLNEYNDSNYYDEALYNLGLMLNKAGEAEKSREVLERLREEAPYSEYNNSRVYEILN